MIQPLVNWRGPGWYVRNKHWKVSDEGGIARDIEQPWRWDKSHFNDGHAYRVESEQDILDLERRYLGEQ